GLTASPLPFKTICSAPADCGGATAGAAPPPPPAGAGAFGSGVMKAQSGPGGAPAANATAGNKALANSKAIFFMKPSLSRAHPEGVFDLNFIGTANRQQGADGCDPALIPKAFDERQNVFPSPNVGRPIRLGCTAPSPTSPNVGRSAF